jgi:diguanylate cyclase (GGDEF)-like protein/PAS domain S-box-containing protein
MKRRLGSWAWAAALLILVSGAVAWRLSTSAYLARANDLIERHAQLASERAQYLAESIDRNLADMQGIPTLFASHPEIVAAARRYGSAALPPGAARDDAQKRWLAEVQLHRLDEYLEAVKANLGINLIYLLNASGSCIASSNWQDSEHSLVGGNFTERQYFRDALNGKPARQYAFGKMTRTPGFYFSAPVLVDGRVQGVMIVKVDVRKLSRLVGQSDALVTDENDVVVMARDEGIELHRTSNLVNERLSRAELQSRYQRPEIPEFAIASWGDAELPQLGKLPGSPDPYVLRTAKIPAYGLTVHVVENVAPLLQYRHDRLRNFVQVWLIAAFLVIAGTATTYYVRALRQRRDDLRESELRQRKAAGLYEGLSLCLQEVIYAPSESELFARICQAAVNYTGLSMAWVGLLDVRTKAVIPVAMHGSGLEYLDGIVISAKADEASGRGPTGTAIREGRPVWSDDFLNDPTALPWRDRARAFGWQSVASLPLTRGDAVVGSMNVYSVRAGQFEESVRRLLVELAEGISLALSRFEDLRVRGAMERDLKVAVDRLSKEKEKFETLMQTSGDGLHILDPQGRLIEANQRFCEMLGYSREELLAMHISDIDARYSPAEGRVMLQEIAARAMVFESLHRCKDGRTIDVEISSKPVALDGSPVVWAASRDITERKAIQAQLKRSESEFRQVMHMLPYGIVIHREGRVVRANQMAAKWLAGTEDVERVTGEPVLKYVHPDYAAIVARRIQQTLAGAESPAIYEKFVRANGEVFDAEVTSLPVSFEGKPSCLVLFADVTARKRQEDELRLAASIYENSNQGMVITDARNVIIAVNPAFSTVTGFEETEVIGRSAAFLYPKRQLRRMYREMIEGLKARDRWEGEFWNHRKDGNTYAEQVSVSVIRNDDGTVFRHIAQISDVTDQRMKDEKIWNEANFDSLTGLPNRRLFLDRLVQEIKHARRAGTRMALVFIDLDRFKEVNDTLGHSSGDRLLVEASRRISACVRDTDTVARLGGDEFTVILPNWDRSQSSERIAHELVDSLSKAYDLGEDGTAFVTASVGIAIYPDDAQEPSALMRHADQAMYGAKETGRNRYSFFTASMQEVAQEKLALTNDLRRAMAAGQLEIHYQPIVDLASGAIESAEALLRWNHPTRGLIGPGIFIPIAEDSGLIHEIGNWVFLQAIEQVRRWLQRYGRRIAISVNKSPVQFQRDGGFAWLEALRAAGLPPNSIAVEITEGSLLREELHVQERIRECRRSGVEISIDDFGTGFSSLSYLKQFDVDYLKIDRSFVSQIAENDTGGALPEAIVVMAHKLGIRTVAEGVETEAQLKKLKAYGCDFAQGYLFSRAVPAAEFEARFLAGKAAEAQDVQPSPADRAVESA